MKRRGAIKLWVAVVVSTAACGKAATQATLTDDPVPSTTAAPAHVNTGPGVEVTVQGRDLGSLAVSVGALAAAAQNDSRPWVEHDMRITNKGDSPVFLNDIRQAAFLGEPHTLVAGDSIGCGYGFSDNEPVSPACQGDYRPFAIPAH